MTGPVNVDAPEVETVTADYAYDPAGNRTGVTVQSPAGVSETVAQFNPGNQLVSAQTTGVGASSSSYGYDGNGNRTTATVGEESTSYSFDATGRMTGASGEDRETSYAYDGLGRMLSSTDTTEFGSQTTTQVWDGLAPGSSRIRCRV